MDPVLLYLTIYTGSHPSDPLKFSFYLGHSVFSSISGISAPVNLVKPKNADLIKEEELLFKDVIN